MIPYEELAAALAGQRSAPRPVPQSTVIDTASRGRAPQHTVIDQPPVLAPPPALEDPTFNGLDIPTGEVDIGDVIADDDL